jgi:hypothetical protein
MYGYGQPYMYDIECSVHNMYNLLLFSIGGAAQVSSKKSADAKVGPFVFLPC